MQKIYRVIKVEGATWNESVVASFEDKAEAHKAAESLSTIEDNRNFVLMEMLYSTSEEFMREYLQKRINNEEDMVARHQYKLDQHRESLALIEERKNEN